MTKKNKTLDTLVQDIYKVIEVLNEDEAIDIPEDIYEQFGRDMEDALRHWATPIDRPRMDYVCLTLVDLYVDYGMT